MKVSVALCTYNGEKYLKEQLDSILNQSRKPDEVVVCDDKSSDSTWSILEHFIQEAPFEVRLIRNEHNLGSTANFAKAISLCTGEIIFLSDQDDVWLPGKLAVVADVLEQDPDVGMVFSNAFVTNEYLQPYAESLWECVKFDKDMQRLCLQGRLWSVLTQRSYVTGATMAFSSKWKFLLDPFPTKWVHDEWITILIDVMSKIKFVPEKLILYRQHQNQQIGVKIGEKKKGPFARFRKSIFPDKSRHRYKRDIERVKFLIDRISKYRNVLRESDMYDEVLRKWEYWCTRYNLPHNPWKRWRIIRKELDAGHYRRYSQSNIMALKDFFF